MTAYEIVEFPFLPINETDDTHVREIADSIREHGWKGCPILYSAVHHELITGSHRVAALLLLDAEGFDLDTLGDIDVAEDVDDILNAWYAENECTTDTIPRDWLAPVFAGTWVEEYKDEIAEW